MFGVTALSKFPLTGAPIKIFMVNISAIMKEKITAARRLNQKSAVPKKQPVKDDNEPARKLNFVGFFKTGASKKNEPTVKIKMPADVKRGESNYLERAQKIYAEALGFLEDIFLKAKNNTPIDYFGVGYAVNSILQELIAGNEHLVNMASSPANLKNNYLYIHVVNTTILSLVVGIDIKFNISQLKDLGEAAFLHDIGICHIMDLIQSDTFLNETEKKEVRKHPHWGLEQLRKIDTISDTVLKVVYEEHERLDGSGYPHGIRGQNGLHECSCIVSAIDVFEAMTHTRPHREALPIHETVKHMLNDIEVRKYDKDVLRSLIRSVGLYPVGSWVELSNHEVAIVTGLNPGHALKPKVNVIFDNQGWKLKRSRPINLTEDLTVHILKPLNNDELKNYWE